MTDPADEPGARQTYSSLAASVFAGVGIGLMVGLMLGLAVPAGDGKSTVAVFIGAVGAALAVLLGLNDRHFSVAKAIRIGSFGLAAVVATLIGITIRAHDLLAPAAPSLAEKKTELEALGYKEPKVFELLQAYITQPGQISETVATRATSRSGLHSTQTSGNTCDFLNVSDWNEPDFESSDVIDGFIDLIGDGSGGKDEVEKWMPLLEVVKKKMSHPSQKNLLFIARNAECGFNDFLNHKILPLEEQCQKFTKGSGHSIEDILKPDDQELVHSQLVQEEKGIVPQERDIANRVLLEFFCR